MKHHHWRRSLRGQKRAHLFESDPSLPTARWSLCDLLPVGSTEALPPGDLTAHEQPCYGKICESCATAQKRLGERA